MSASDNAEGNSLNRWRGLIEACSTINEMIGDGKGDQIPSEIATNLLTCATLLYAQASEGGRRMHDAFLPDVTVTPTDVVVTVSAMLRAADLNSFDLAMWFTARQPEA